MRDSAHLQFFASWLDSDCTQTEEHREKVWPLDFHLLNVDELNLLQVLAHETVLLNYPPVGHDIDISHPGSHKLEHEGDTDDHQRDRHHQRYSAKTTGRLTPEQ